ncbi:hypothetical protein [Nioella nitratireducens]|uniref:hypothetical protein n=1 Tax=Nioella nitratireducens TaxID=1287720 RepID=UPI0008FCFE06|nr:hypothetical protein [Nioella nitratireducens]
MKSTILSAVLLLAAAPLASAATIAGAPDAGAPTKLAAAGETVETGVKPLVETGASARMLVDDSATGDLLPSSSKK